LTYPTTTTTEEWKRNEVFVASSTFVRLVMLVMLMMLMMLMMPLFFFSEGASY
jgi:hypothetical protein